MNVGFILTSDSSCMASGIACEEWPPQIPVLLVLPESREKILGTLINIKNDL